MKHFFFLSFFLLTVLGTSGAQTLMQPRESQRASVSQRIGITDVTVVYHAPQTKGRKIWGALVPYNKVWRSGANENTTISFTHDVTIEGKPLAAGTYGLHTIPSEKEWTIIFSKNSTSWGSFTYKQEEDALRVAVKPAAVPMQDWLSYDFIDRNPKSVVLALTWEKLRVPVRIDVDVKNVVLANIRNEVRGRAWFNWQGPYEAANYSLENNFNFDEALKWIDRSLLMKQNFSNLHVKAGLLEKTGKAKEASEIMARAMTIADEAELNQYGYELLGQKKSNDALAAFEMNAKAHPDSWNVYDSLADGFAQTGNERRALENYRLALQKAPEDQRSRIEEEVKKMEIK